MFINSPHEIDIEIDGLTDSIVCCKTGARYETQVIRLEESDLKQPQMRKGWRFDWSVEFAYSERQLYKLVLDGQADKIQGLISTEKRAGHYYMHLIESAAINIGMAKMYRGVPANLVAFICKLSYEAGYCGVVSFTAKTELVEHYQRTLEAKLIGYQNMAIFEIPAQKLINRYFSNH